ncbi:MAG: peptidase MA family metallohydrolase, partial [Chloroflexota bacterium]
MRTDKFIIVYAEEITKFRKPVTCLCGVEEAEAYALFIDEIYNELATVFAVDLDLPVTLYLYPTEESYYEVNPLAEQLAGVIAHALNNRDEIAVALTRTEKLPEEVIVNNVRHEMTHLFASNLSAGNLTTGFQEGIAQYLEQPTDAASFDPAILALALDEGRLLTWAELDEAREVYSDPQVAYPQSLSIVSFLVDQYGFPSFLQFLEATAVEPGYRSALEQAYNVPADDLEQAWLAYLPDYFAGRWQINAIYAYDLTRVSQLVDQGAYTDAATELADIVTLLETT